MVWKSLWAIGSLATQEVSFPPRVSTTSEKLWTIFKLTTEWKTASMTVICFHTGRNNVTVRVIVSLLCLMWQKWKRRKQGCYGQTSSDWLTDLWVFISASVCNCIELQSKHRVILAGFHSQLICICPLWFPQLNYFLTITLYLNKYVSTDRMDLLCVNPGKSREFSKDPPT